MQRTEVLSERERFIRATAERLKREARELPAYQTRTCTHCGVRTTFGLQDRAGWYACLECGRYA
jgi:transposase